MAIQTPVGGATAVDILQTLLRFDTSNPPGRERACLEYVAGLFKGAGLEHRFLSRDPDRPNLVATLRGRGAAPPLLLYGHVDVVPTTRQTWRHPPFAGEIIDGVVWGRGTLDMKGGVAVILAAVLRAKAEGFEPAGNVIVALTSDEERGSTPGARFLVEEHGDLFADVRHALSEFGGFTQWVGGRAFYPVQVAEKQACVLRVTIRGNAGHPSTIVRGTAAAKLGTLLTRLERKRLPVHITPVVRQMLETMSDALPTPQRLALRPLLVPALTGRVLDVLGKDGRSLDPLFHNTATVTIVKGGESVNVIPSEIDVELDGRCLPGQSPGDLVRELEALVPDVTGYEIVREEPASRPDPDMALFPMLDGILRELEPAGTPFPMLLPGYTDARLFSKLGIQTYGFLPLRLPPEITTDLIHAADERVPAAAIEFGAEAVYRAISRYAG